MYGNFGSISGIVHVYARRPVVASAVVLALVTVAALPKTPTPPPAPPAPAVVTYVAPTPEPTPAYAGSHKNTTYQCEIGSKGVPTNLCKATLDSIADFLHNDTAATVKIEGRMSEALAVRKYFTAGESKLGIDTSRIGISIIDSNSNTVDVTQVP